MHDDCGRGYSVAPKLEPSVPNPRSRYLAAEPRLETVAWDRTCPHLEPMVLFRVKMPAARSFGVKSSSALATTPSSTNARGRSRPEIRTLARALAIEDGARRKEFLQHTFTKLDELDEFVKFVQEGIDYLGDDFGFAVRTNMPQEHFDKMKAIYAEAAALRRKYLQ